MYGYKVERSFTRERQLSLL